MDLSVSVKNQSGYVGEYLGEPDCFLNFAYGDWNLIQTGRQASDGSPLWQVTLCGLCWSLAGAAELVAVPAWVVAETNAGRAKPMTPSTPITTSTR